MRLVCRPIRPQHFKRFATIFFGGHFHNKEFMEIIESEWDFNLKQKSFLGLHVLDLDRPEPEQWVGIVKTVFVTPSFVADCFKNPTPWVNQRIQQPCSDGQPALLAENEILEHNADEGLHGLVTRWTVSPACQCRDERLLVRHMLHQSFSILWRGFKLASLTLETVGEEAPHEAKYAGLRLLSEYQEQFPHLWQPGEGLRPRLFHLGRREALVSNSWLVNGAFAHQEPRYGLCLSRNEIELVRWALLGLSNVELSEVLNITPAGIQQRWKSLYKKIEAKGAFVSTSKPENKPETGPKRGRGAEKREPLLQFFRALPEELYGI